jgi:hypothetical protein
VLSWFDNDRDAALDHVFLFKKRKKKMWKPIATMCALLMVTAVLSYFISTLARIPERTISWTTGVSLPREKSPMSNLGENTSIEAGHADVVRFASFAFGHEEGFVAATALSRVTATTRLFFYKLTDSGTLLKLPEEPLVPSFPAGEPSVVVTGAFMPPRQVPSEVLYLFVVLGVLDNDGHPCGRKFILYYYDKDVRAPGSQVWTHQRDFVIEHPFYPTNLYLNPDIPAFVACLGNHIQGVVDDNAGNGQALYVSTSDFDRVNPNQLEPGSGGGVLWYEFLSYGRNPFLQLRMALKDAKLASGVRSSILSGKLSDYYLLGFGSCFFVQSGQGSENLLAVANQTDQDTSDIICPNAVNSSAPNGYVQVFRASTRQSLGWEQITVSCGSDKVLFSDRLWLNPVVTPTSGPFESSNNRFGHSLLILDNFIFIGINSTAVSIYKLTTPALPPLNLQVGSVALSTIETPVALPGRVVQRRFFAHKQFLVSSGRTIQPNTIGVLVWSISNSSSQVRFSNTGDPILSIGDLNANSGLASTDDDWFGNSCFALTASNQRSHFLVCNDPGFSPVGRLLIQSLV